MQSITKADQSFHILMNSTAKARGTSKFQAVIGLQAKKAGCTRETREGNLFILGCFVNLVMYILCC